MICRIKNQELMKQIDICQLQALLETMQIFCVPCCNQIFLCRHCHNAGTNCFLLFASARCSVRRYYRRLMLPYQDPFGSNTLNQPKAILNSPQAKDGGKKSVDKKAAVDEEMKRMNKLPPNTAYATQWLRILDKVLPTFVHSSSKT